MAGQKNWVSPHELIKSILLAIIIMALTIQGASATVYLHDSMNNNYPFFAFQDGNNLKIAERTGEFSVNVTSKVDAGSEEQIANPADYDGDGKLEVPIRNQNDYIIYYKFPSLTEDFSVTEKPKKGAQYLADDINNDNVTELIFADANDNGILKYINNPSGSDTVETLINTNVKAIGPVDIGDFNKDGVKEVLYHPKSSSQTIKYMNMTGGTEGSIHEKGRLVAFATSDFLLTDLTEGQLRFGIGHKDGSDNSNLGFFIRGEDYPQEKNLPGISDTETTSSMDGGTSVYWSENNPAVYIGTESNGKAAICQGDTTVTCQEIKDSGGSSFGLKAARATIPPFTKEPQLNTSTVDQGGNIKLSFNATDREGYTDIQNHTAMVKLYQPDGGLNSTKKADNIGGENGLPGQNRNGRYIPSDGATKSFSTKKKIPSNAPTGTWNVTAQVQDEKMTGTLNWTTFDVVAGNEAPNNPENISNVSTADGDTAKVSLSVDVSDPDGDDMNVSFYDNSTDNLISKELNIPNNSGASIQWTGLDYNASYNWYVNVSDGEAINQSIVYSFKTVREFNKNSSLNFSFDREDGRDSSLRKDIPTGLSFGSPGLSLADMNRDFTNPFNFLRDGSSSKHALTQLLSEFNVFTDDIEGFVSTASAVRNTLGLGDGYGVDTELGRIFDIAYAFQGSELRDTVSSRFYGSDLSVTPAFSRSNTLSRVMVSSLGFNDSISFEAGTFVEAAYEFSATGGFMRTDGVFERDLTVDLVTSEVLDGNYFSYRSLQNDISFLRSESSTGLYSVGLSQSIDFVNYANSTLNLPRTVIDSYSTGSITGASVLFSRTSFTDVITGNNIDRGIGVSRIFTSYINNQNSVSYSAGAIEAIEYALQMTGNYSRTDADFSRIFRQELSSLTSPENVREISIALNSPLEFLGAPGRQGVFTGSFSQELGFQDNYSSTYMGSRRFSQSIHTGLGLSVPGSFFRTDTTNFGLAEIINRKDATFSRELVRAFDLSPTSTGFNGVAITFYQVLGLDDSKNTVFDGQRIEESRIAAAQGIGVSQQLVRTFSQTFDVGFNLDDLIDFILEYFRDLISPGLEGDNSDNTGNNSNNDDAGNNSNNDDTGNNSNNDDVDSVSSKLSGKNDSDTQDNRTLQIEVNMNNTSTFVQPSIDVGNRLDNLSKGQRVSINLENSEGSKSSQTVISDGSEIFNRSEAGGELNSASSDQEDNDPVELEKIDFEIRENTFEPEVGLGTTVDRPAKIFEDKTVYETTNISIGIETSNATLRYRINKSFLNEQNASEEDIKVERRKNGTVVQILDTRVVNETNYSYMVEAYSPEGFSVFLVYLEEPKKTESFQKTQRQYYVLPDIDFVKVLRILLPLAAVYFIRRPLISKIFTLDIWFAYLFERIKISSLKVYRNFSWRKNSSKGKKEFRLAMEVESLEKQKEVLEFRKNLLKRELKDKKRLKEKYEKSLSSLSNKLEKWNDKFGE